MGTSLLLVGCGKMGGALLDGWLKAGTAERVVVVEPDGLPGFAARHPSVTLVGGADELAPELEIDAVVLAVKPQMMDAVVPAYAGLVGPDTVFLSIAAGKTIGYFERHLGGGAAVVRAMPNTPAAVGRGITGAFANAAVTASGRELCDRLLNAVGDVAWIEDEGLMDAVTAVSGSGPAYVFLLAETLAAAGVAAGLPEAVALRLAAATIEGAGELMRQSDSPPSALRAAVTSKGGTTQAALAVLMAEDGLGALMGRAVAAAVQRSRELAD